MHSRRVTSLFTVKYPRPINELPGILSSGHRALLHVLGTENYKQIKATFNLKTTMTVVKINLTSLFNFGDMFTNYQTVMYQIKINL